MAETFDFPKGIKKIKEQVGQTRQPLLLAIAGGSCSGKSYLAAALEESLPAVILPLDSYFLSTDNPLLPRNATGRKIFDAPESYRGDDFTKAATDLLAGKSVALPNYDLVTNKILSGQGKTITAQPVVIAEGLYAITFLHQLSAPMIKVFLNTTLSLCLGRRIERDVPRWNVTAEKVEEIFLVKVLPYYHRYISLQKNLADIIINQ